MAIYVKKLVCTISLIVEIACIFFDIPILMINAKLLIRYP